MKIKPFPKLTNRRKNPVHHDDHLKTNKHPGQIPRSIRANASRPPRATPLPATAMPYSAHTYIHNFQVKWSPGARVVNQRNPANRPTTAVYNSASAARVSSLYHLAPAAAHQGESEREKHLPDGRARAGIPYPPI